MFNILVIEIHQVNRIILQGLLEDNNVDILFGISVEESVELVESQPIDLLLIHLQDPYAEVWETVNLIRLANQELPIVIMGCPDDVLLKTELFRAGANVIMDDSVELPRLASRLEKILDMNTFKI